MDRENDAVIEDIGHAVAEHSANTGLDHVFIFEIVVLQIFVDLVVVGIQTDIEVFDLFFQQASLGKIIHRFFAKLGCTQQIVAIRDHC